MAIEILMYSSWNSPSLKRRQSGMKKKRGNKIIKVLVRFNITAKKNHSEKVVHLRAYLERKLL